MENEQTIKTIDRLIKQYREARTNGEPDAMSEAACNIMEVVEKITTAPRETIDGTIGRMSITSLFSQDNVDMRDSLG